MNLNINDHKLNLLRNELAKARADWLKEILKMNTLIKVLQFSD